MFTFKCPHCGKAIEADETFIGQTADCPFCSRPVEIKKAATLYKAGKHIVFAKSKKAPYVPKSLIEDQRQNSDKSFTLEFWIGFFFSFFGVIISWFTGSHKGARSAAFGCLTGFIVLGLILLILSAIGISVAAVATH